MRELDFINKRAVSMEDELEGNQEITNNYLKKVLIVFGTRPEVIKMPLVNEFLKDKVNFDIRVCITAQHRKVVNVLKKVLV